MVCKLTGHKDPKSLANYDPGIGDLLKIDMAVGIATAGASLRGETVELPSSELKRRIETSKIYNKPKDMIEDSPSSRRKEHFVEELLDSPSETAEITSNPDALTDLLVFDEPLSTAEVEIQTSHETSSVG